MGLNLEQKQAVVAEVSTQLAQAQAVILAEYRSLRVGEMTALRKKARTAGIYLRVLKNTLARRAVADTPFKGLSEKMVGPLAYGISSDPVAAAKVLQEFARRLQSVIRPTDVAARLGGDEFGVALCGIRSHADAQRVADNILNAIKAPMQIGQQSISIGASVGIATNAAGEGGWQGLIQHADEMLYRAKRSGRGRSQIYSVK